MRKRNNLLLKVVAALSVSGLFISVTWIQRSSLQFKTSLEIGTNVTPLLQNKSVVPATEPTPLEKIRLWMNTRYNDEEAIRKSTKYWSNQLAVISPGKQKTILFYNRFWYWPDYGIGEGSDIFKEMGYPVSNCLATYNRSLVKPEEADAIIWHAVKERSLPTKRLAISSTLSMKLIQISAHKNGVLPNRAYFSRGFKGPLQANIFIALFNEANVPYHFAANRIEFAWRGPLKHLDNPKYTKFFNYTMTISRAADIFDPYGIMSKVDKSPPLKTAKNFAHGKTKMAVWFASHCITQSNREKFVKEIQKYFKVEIYGKCGEFKCQKNKINQNDESCLKKIERSYKFYFALENSLCKEYISEKFFDAMKLDIIPVVYGLGNYEEIASPHSYINILSFRSIKAAVDHMIYLSKNDTAYNEYFWWKDHYKALSLFTRKKTPEYKDISWCSLCKKLHTDNQVKSYTRIQPFATSANCFSSSHTIINELFQKHDAA